VVFACINAKKAKKSGEFVVFLPHIATKEYENGAVPLSVYLDQNLKAGIK